MRVVNVSRSCFGVYGFDEMRLILGDVVRRTETIQQGLQLSLIAVILVLEDQVGTIVICDALVVPLL